LKLLDQGRATIFVRGPQSVIILCLAGHISVLKGYFQAKKTDLRGPDIDAGLMLPPPALD